MDESRRRKGCWSLLFSLGLVTLLASAEPARANPEVYTALPDDTRVIQYDMGDLDGDLLEELVVLYTSGGIAHLALFKVQSGHWSTWWADNGALAGMERASPHSVELADINGNGKDEILTYHITDGGRGMVARIIALDTADPEHISAGILLEDTTVPPGYPLFGFENGTPSVTFLEMPLEKGDIGYRRVYCWDGIRFEKCVEIPWKKP